MTIPPGLIHSAVSRGLRGLKKLPIATQMAMLTGVSEPTAQAVEAFGMGATEPLNAGNVSRALDFWKSRVFGDASGLADPVLTPSFKKALIQYLNTSEGKPHNPLSPYGNVTDRQTINALRRLEQKVSPSEVVEEVSDYRRGMGGRKGLRWAEMGLSGAALKELIQKIRSDQRTQAVAPSQEQR